MRRLALAIILMCAASAACAQSNVPIYQTGLITPGHLPVWTTNGVVQDDVQNGQYTANAFGITALGLPFCINDTVTTNPGGFHQFCMGSKVTLGGHTGMFFTYNAYGGAAAQNPWFDINGVNYEFPFTLSGVVGPATTTIGDAAAWNNTQGTLLKDSGAPPALEVADIAALRAVVVTSLPAGFSAGVNAYDVATDRTMPRAMYSLALSGCDLNAGAGDSGSEIPPNGGGSYCWHIQPQSGGVSPLNFGAYGDVRTVRDTGTTTVTSGSPAVTISSGTFTSADVGKYIIITDNTCQATAACTTPDGPSYQGTITAVASATSISVSPNPSFSTASYPIQTTVWGHADDVAMNAAIAYVGTIAQPTTTGVEPRSMPTLMCGGLRYGVVNPIVVNTNVTMPSCAAAAMASAGFSVTANGIWSLEAGANSTQDNIAAYSDFLPVNGIWWDVNASTWPTNPEARDWLGSGPGVTTTVTGTSGNRSVTVGSASGLTTFMVSHGNSGSGIPDGALIVGIVGTTVYINHFLTSSPSGASVTFYTDPSGIVLTSAGGGFVRSANVQQFGGKNNQRNSVNGDRYGCGVLIRGTQIHFNGQNLAFGAAPVCDDGTDVHINDTQFDNDTFNVPVVDAPCVVMGFNAAALYIDRSQNIGCQNQFFQNVAHPEVVIGTNRYVYGPSAVTFTNDEFNDVVTAFASTATTGRITISPLGSGTGLGGPGLVGYSTVGSGSWGWNTAQLASIAAQPSVLQCGGMTCDFGQDAIDHFLVQTFESNCGNGSSGTLTVDDTYNGEFVDINNDSSHSCTLSLPNTIAPGFNVRIVAEGKGTVSVNPGSNVSVDGEVATTFYLSQLTPITINCPRVDATPNLLCYTNYNPPSGNYPPSINSGFGTSPSISGNNQSFVLNVGTGGTAQTGVLHLMPAAVNGWNCWFININNPGQTQVTQETNDTSGSVTLSNYNSGGITAWPSGSILRGGCVAH